MEQLPSDGSIEELLGFLITLVREAARGTPIARVRFPLPELGEISLTAGESESAPRSPSDEESLDGLSFEISDAEEHAPMTGQ